MNTRRTVLLGKQIVNQRADDILTKLRRNAFTALLENVKIEQKKHTCMVRMIRNIRKFHLFNEMRRFKLQTSLLAQIRDKDKINGAYLLLKRFKDRLKAFDRALQAIDNAKANVTEFEYLKQSIDQARSQSIF